MNLFFSLLKHPLQELVFLRQDFLAVSLNFSILYSLIINILFPSALIIIFYLIGSKIKLRLFKKDEKIIDVFVSIALGYIFTASGILILGMLGILYHLAIFIYMVAISIAAVLPLKTSKARLIFLKVVYKEYFSQFNKYIPVNLAVLGFVLIGFLRLIPPEVGVDAIWYHTDYPRIYLNAHSMMNINPIGKYYPAVVPALSDMLYVVTQSFDVKNSSRFIHFSFYVLSIMVYLTVFRKKYGFAPFAALLLATSPTIIRVTSSAYAEFEWIFCWLLAVFIITSKSKRYQRNVVLSGILIGGTLATKLWMIPFFGIFILYLIITNIRLNKIKLLKLITVFSIIAVCIPLLWYLRAFIITGNPLFPTFWSYPNGQFNNPAHLNLDLESIKERISIATIVSPFSILGFIFLFSSWSKIKNLIMKNNSFFLFSVILIITQILINYNYPRFVVPFYSIIAITLAFGINKFINLTKYFYYLFYFLVSCLFLYYFINSLLTLPYGLGWADENKYLTRILSRDNSSYYDYNKQFSKLISDKDVVATYGHWGFYYADFSYIYAEDVLRKKRPSLKSLKETGATKLLILGGDLSWFCKVEKLTDCYLTKYRLLTYYRFSTTNSAQYLYQLTKHEE